MNHFDLTEDFCRKHFASLAPMYHICSGENFPIIFSSEKEFKIGMTILGLCSLRIPAIKVLTFILMSNHFHIIAAGSESLLEQLVEMFVKYLQNCFSAEGITAGISRLDVKYHPINDLEYSRNTICYCNRNGFVINSNYTPFTYPWGANTLYFSPDSVILYETIKKHMTVRARRTTLHTKAFDEVSQPMCIKDCLSPLCFCDIKAGEMLFRNPRHYFSKLSRNIECMTEIANILGESQYYTDDDLYAFAISVSKKKYGCNSLLELAHIAKLELAKTLHFDFKANNKAIHRLLGLDLSVLQGMFPQ